MSTSPLGLTEVEWVKSTYSDGDGGECVEFSRTLARSGAVPVRDSKAPEGASLVVSSGAWSVFVSLLKEEQA